MEEAINTFALFGGLTWKIDLSRPIFEVIEAYVLKNYKQLHKEISHQIEGENISHALLAGIALGDGRTHSAFKRARIDEYDGKPMVSMLCDYGILDIEPCIACLKDNRSMVSQKAQFTIPFLRFWFAFVAPLYKGIKEGDHSEVKERFENRKEGFSELVFKQLSIEIVKKRFESDPIIKIGSYWDKDIEIDIVARTTGGKIIVGASKFTNSKMKKTELTKLQEKAKQADLEVDVFVLFSKEGFTKELKDLKGESLRLISLNGLKTLLEE